MKIELYNEKWLRKQNSSTPTHSTIVDQPSSNLDARSFHSHPDIFPTITALHKETSTVPILYDDESLPPLSVRKLPSSDTTDFIPAYVPNTPTNDVVQALLQFREKLCFIQYTPEGTLVQRWYLFKFELDVSVSVNANGVRFILLLFFGETPCGH